MISILNVSHSYDGDDCEYVGYSKQTLGLANPWSHQNQIQARWKTTTKGEALYRYREWLLGRLVANFISGIRFTGLDDWEVSYLKRVIWLSGRIETEQTRVLKVLEDINELNYHPVPDGMEKSHAEILYKACLQLIEKRNGVLTQ
ncbi:hypothetical protein H6G27_09945 [Nostoc linckia FACHB-104]|nr:hypothetical protein [Nostoc linckia FACHB-104]